MPVFVFVESLRLLPYDPAPNVFIVVAAVLQPARTIQREFYVNSISGNGQLPHNVQIEVSK